MGIEQPWQRPAEEASSASLRADEIDTSYLLVLNGTKHEISQAMRLGQDQVRLVLENGESLIYDLEDSVEAVKRSA